ncbi:3-oxoacyl-[acyl-carrier-protein] synthase 2 [Artemisia annua]|uniref:3-oxoacyl-[acyl-carrier-protein] synthase 2 n=1 Tax=Artemisia annua TaxID=35608 RepID=A0A2U1KRD4_ARTAN|nr:3-oxoacyl-[acyl-carrier-protein] synthase 2 [Artemisia annua]
MTHSLFRHTYWWSSHYICDKVQIQYFLKNNMGGKRTLGATMTDSPHNHSPYFYYHLSPPTTIDISSLTLSCCVDILLVILMYHLSHPCRNIVTSLKLINDFHTLLQDRTGPTYSISTACITSNFCILNAANHIIDGDAEAVFVNSYPVKGASIS